MLIKFDRSLFKITVTVNFNVKVTLIFNVIYHSYRYLHMLCHGNGNGKFNGNGNDRGSVTGRSRWCHVTPLTLNVVYT